MKNPCSVLSNKSHSLGKVSFTNKLLHSSPSFLTFFPSFIYLLFYNSQNQRERRSTKHTWNKRSEILLFNSLLSLSHAFQSVLLMGVHLAHFIFFFFLAGIGKACKCPKKRTEFPLQLIFIRNTINNTWHFNKTLSEWFNEKQIHYVKNQ